MLRNLFKSIHMTHYGSAGVYRDDTGVCTRNGNGKQERKWRAGGRGDEKGMARFIGSLQDENCSISEEF